MENKADLLMVSGVVSFCPDCGDDRLFVPVRDECATDGCEFCCTTCDAAVYLMSFAEAGVASGPRTGADRHAAGSLA